MKILLFVIITLVILLFVSFLFQIIKQKRKNKLLLNIKNKQFEKQLNQFINKILIPPYDKDELLLNYYLYHKEEENIQKHYQRMLKLYPYKENQTYLKVFEYYVYDYNQKESHKLLKQIKQTNNTDLINHCYLLYDIIILKKTNYKEDMIAHYQQYQDRYQKSILAYLISLQYKNENNIQEYNKYNQLSKQNLT